MRHLKNRRLCIFAALVLFLLPSPMLFSETVLDWGGSATGTAEFSDFHDFDAFGTDKIEPSAQAALWMRSRFSETLSLYGRAAYSYTSERPCFADVQSLYASGRFILGESGGTGSPTLLSYRAGRFGFGEFTGYVFYHVLDGFRLNFEHRLFSIEAGAGYTGLSFIPSSSILVTEGDVQNKNDAPDSFYGGYELASPKIIETVKLTLPGILMGQDIVVNGVLQQDLKAEDAEDGKIHTIHSGIGSRGRIVPSVYQSTFFYHNFGFGEYTTSAYLFGGGLNYYNKNLLYSRISLRGLYSSGDNDQDSFYGGYEGDGEISGHFIKLSASPPSGLVFSPEIGNISLGELSWSLQPFAETAVRALERFQSSLSALAFFRNTGGAISKGGIDYSSSESYLGSEVDVNLRFRPTSDLGLFLGGGVFIPNKAVFTEDKESVQTVLRADLRFSF
ncbi:MAG: hypothetical protein ACLFQW_03415 [Spirochaetaceae bacterium]